MEANRLNFNAGKVYGRSAKPIWIVHLDGNPGLMHHKVMIIDRPDLYLADTTSQSAETKNMRIWW